MIAAFLRVFFLALISLVIAWATFLFMPSLALEAAKRDATSFAASFPGVHHVPNGSMLTALPSGLSALVSLAPDQRRIAADLVARRTKVAAGLLPFFLAAFAVSVFAGSLVRERLRLGTAYASPTLSFLSKRVAEAALLVFFVWSFSPLPLPYGVFYPSIFAAMVGGFGYVANLPLKL